MENFSKTKKASGLLFIIGALAVLVPYTILTITFNYPDVLRKDTASILTAFHEGGTGLIGTWFAFAIAGLPLIPAYIFLGQAFQKQSSLIRLATSIGLIGLIVQMIGLLRWTFVVPVLANSFVYGIDEPTKAAAIMSFKTIHQFGGVLLGEHMGQLFSIAWTILITIALRNSKLLPRWVNILGITSSVIYLLAQAELFATVIPGFPVWNLAGFVGSTLWLVWIITLGIYLIKKSNNA